MDPNWYQDFFRGVVLDLWREAVSPEQTRAEVDFVERHLDVPARARILDVPCGHGRHAIELASRGHDVTGVDLSRGAIEEAAKLAAAVELPVEWICGDMRDLPGESEFDGGFCLGNSFGYLEPSGMRLFASALARALKPGARLVIDSGMVAESILPNLKQRQQTQVGDILFTEENRYRAIDSCVETEYTFIRGGETHVCTGLHWVYTVREMRQLLAEVGLVTTNVYSSLEAEPFSVGCPYLLLVAQKE